MDLIKQLKKASEKQKSNIDFTSKDFKDFITKATTINLFFDSLTDYIQNFITDDTLKNTTAIDFETIGKMFFTLILYKLNPTNYNDKEHRKLLKLDKDQWEQASKLIDLYNFTMINPYKNRLNGLKGGAPKQNTNAKKKTTATDIDNLPTMKDYQDTSNYNYDNE